MACNCKPITSVHISKPISLTPDNFLLKKEWNWIFDTYREIIEDVCQGIIESYQDVKIDIDI